jgi:hypothetical protein
MLRVAGIVALIVLATACGSTPVTTVASPSPVIAQGTWIEGLTFTGDLPGQMTGIIADTGGLLSACTGEKSRTGDIWADTFYGTLDSSASIWGVVFTIHNFSGPGTYANSAERNTGVADAGWRQDHLHHRPHPTIRHDRWNANERNNRKSGSRTRNRPLELQGLRPPGRGEG